MIRHKERERESTKKRAKERETWLTGNLRSSGESALSCGMQLSTMGSKMSSRVNKGPAKVSGSRGKQERAGKKQNKTKQKTIVLQVLHELCVLLRRDDVLQAQGTHIQIVLFPEAFVITAAAAAAGAASPPPVVCSPLLQFMQLFLLQAPEAFPLLLQRQLFATFGGDTHLAGVAGGGRRLLSRPPKAVRDGGSCEGGTGSVSERERERAKGLWECEGRRKGSECLIFWLPFPLPADAPPRLFPLRHERAQARNVWT